MILSNGLDAPECREMRQRRHLANCIKTRSVQNTFLLLNFVNSAMERMMDGWCLVQHREMSETRNKCQITRLPVLSFGHFRFVSDIPRCCTGHFVSRCWSDAAVKPMSSGYSEREDDADEK